MIVHTTVGERDDARRIARELVQRKLAACVQILGPIESYYHWQGELQCDPEWLCLIKTQASRYDELEAVLRQLHPYDEPEIVATEFARGSAGYLEWLNVQTSGDKAE